MPAFNLAEKYLEKERKGNALQGLKLAACLHVSRETAVLVEALNRFGMKVRLVAANPLSSQQEIVEFLSEEGVEIDAKRGETVEEYEKAIERAAESSPDLIVDDGGELHVAYAQRTKLTTCFGGTDETTTGSQRLRALARSNKLRYPVIPVNEAETKHIFDNKYGSGQSGLDGLLRATGLLIAGKVVVVAGFGWVGRGVALRARGLGARVIVTEVNPTKALEAHLDGFEVKSMNDACKEGDIFLTCTGQIEVIRKEHFLRMKDGAILGNVGHFDQEIDVRGLYSQGTRVEQIGRNLSRIDIATRNGRKRKKLYLISQGRVINLAAASGHPPEVMQLSFANQLLSLNFLAQNRRRLARLRGEDLLLPFPKEIDELVSKFALRAFGISIDRLTDRQRKYAISFSRSW